MKLLLLAAIFAITVALEHRPIEVTVPAPVVVAMPSTVDDSHTVRVMKDVILYGGRFVSSVQAARCPDSPCFIDETLLDALRADLKRPRQITLSIDDDVSSRYSDTGDLRLRILFTILRAGNDAVVTSF
jgi:hypothetical protein